MLAVEDTIAIQQTILKYGHIVDAEEWDRLSELFTDDLVFVSRHADREPSTTLREVIERWSAPDYPHPIGHHATNVLIESDEDGVVKVVWKGVSVDRDGRTRSLIYFEHLRRTDEGWRIFWRRVTQQPSDVR